MNLLDDDDDDQPISGGTGSNPGQTPTPKPALASIFSREKVQPVSVRASVPVPIPTAARRNIPPALARTFPQGSRAGEHLPLQRAPGLAYQRQPIPQQGLPYAQTHVPRTGSQRSPIPAAARITHAVRGLQRAGAQTDARVQALQRASGQVAARVPGMQRASAHVAARVPGMQRAGGQVAARVPGMQRAGGQVAARVPGMQRAGGQNAAIAGARITGMQRSGVPMAAAQAGRFPGMQRAGAGMASVAGGRMSHSLAGGNGYPRGGVAGRGYPGQHQGRGAGVRGPQGATGKGSNLSAHALIMFFQNLRRFVSAPTHAQLVKRYSKTRISTTTEAERRQIVAEMVRFLGRALYIKAITFSKKKSKESSKMIMGSLKKVGTEAQWKAISGELKKFIAAGNSAPEDVLQRILHLLNQTDPGLLKKCTEILRPSAKKRSQQHLQQQPPPNKAGLKPLTVAATSQPIYPNAKKRKASTSSASRTPKQKKKKTTGSAASASTAASAKTKETPTPKKKGKKATPSSAKSSAGSGKKRPYKKRKKSEASAKGSAAKKPKISKTKALEIEAQIRRQRKLEKRLAKQREEARKKEEKQRLRKLRREEKLQAQKKKKKLALAKKRKEALQLARRYAAEASKKKATSPSREPTVAKVEAPPKSVLKEGAKVFQDLFNMPPVKRFGSGITLDAPTNALLPGNVVVGKFDETVVRYNKQFLSSADAGSKMLKLVSTQQSRGVMAKYLLSCLDLILKESATNLVGLYLHRKLGEQGRKPLTYADSIHPRLDHEARINALKDNLYTASEKVKLLAEAQAEKASGSFKKMSEIHDTVLRQRQKLKRELLKKEKENPGGVRSEVMRERAEAVKQYKEDSAKAQNAWKMDQPLKSSSSDTDSGTEPKDRVAIKDLLTHFQQGNKLAKTLWNMF